MITPVCIHTLLYIYISHNYEYDYLVAKRTVRDEQAPGFASREINKEYDYSGMCTYISIRIHTQS